MCFSKIIILRLLFQQWNERKSNCNGHNFSIFQPSNPLIEFGTCVTCAQYTRSHMWLINLGKCKNSAILFRSSLEFVCSDLHAGNFVPCFMKTIKWALVIISMLLAAIVLSFRISIGYFSKRMVSILFYVSSWSGLWFSFRYFLLDLALTLKYEFAIAECL